jgi:hypothetical protein
MKRLKFAKIVNDTGGYVYFEDNIVRPNGVMIVKREEGSRRYTVCVIYGDEQPDGSLRNLQLGEHLVTFIDDAVLVPGTKWYLTLGGLLDGVSAWLSFEDLNCFMLHRRLSHVRGFCLGACSVAHWP